MWVLLLSFIEWLGKLCIRPQPRVKDAPLSDSEEMDDFDNLP